MGIYSTAAANLLKESEVEYNPNAASLLEFAVDAQRSEQAMFETMLEIDFLEYHVESGNIILTEGEKTSNIGNIIKSIGQKIAKLLEKVIQTLEAALNKFINFVAEKSKHDKKILDETKFGSVVLDNLKGKDKKITLLDYSADTQEIFKEYILDLAVDADVVCKNLKNGTDNKSAQDYEAAIEDIKKKFEDNVGDGMIKKYFPEKAIGEVTDADVKNMRDNLSNGYKGIVSKFVDQAKIKSAIKSLNQARASALKAAVIVNKDTTTDQRAAYAARYKYVAGLCTIITKSFHFATSMATKAMATYRKSYTTLVMESKVKATKESAEYNDMFEYALEVATDYMYENASF